MGKKLILSKEEKRQIILDIVLIVSSYSKGVGINDIVNELRKEHEGIDDGKLKWLIRTELPKSVGKITIGERRGVKYVIDDVEVATQLVNEYYDKEMNQLEIWELRKDICEYISKNPGCTTNDVEKEFCVNQDFIDDMNSELVKYNVGIEFYKATSHGTKMRVGNLTLSAINGIISDLSYLRPTPKKISENSGKSLKELDEDSRRKMQIRILEIIYSNDRISSREISKSYYKEYKEVINDDNIRSMMNKVPGIGTNRDESYWIKDINEALRSIDLEKSMIMTDVITKEPLDESKYSGLKFSRMIGDLYVYILKCKNEYSSIITLFNLLIDGASIDPEIRMRVIDIVNKNMSSGKKFIL